MKALEQAALSRLADVYHRSRIGITTGMRISFDERARAHVHWRHVRDYDHAFDMVHGGLLATMLDNAGWFTAAAAHGEWVVTSEFHVRLLCGTSDADLVAVGEIVRQGRRLTVASMDVRTVGGEHVATASGSFCPTGKPLPFAEARR